MSAPVVCLVVAMADNGTIGRDNALPWHLPEDLRHFKAVTMGKPIVMGRKTFESIGRPLPGRANIVVTRDGGWHAEGVRVATGLDQALDMAAETARTDGVGEVMVIGGAQIYAQALHRADRIYLSEVHLEVEGDARFPALDRGVWHEVERRDGVACSFVTLERA